jgi:hypothetical protein
VLLSAGRQYGDSSQHNTGSKKGREKSSHGFH